ncbi:hypothetical protein KCP69_18345 [Salmonella enterica subsp. enterica]|nr:hypothetical protein KCP69_18345 [Salmonella enterica subsp. enterica]
MRINARKPVQLNRRLLFPQRRKLSRRKEGEVRTAFGGEGTASAALTAMLDRLEGAGRNTR